MYLVDWSGPRNNDAGLFTVLSWYLASLRFIGYTKCHQRREKDRQTRTVTTIERDTGEGKMEPQWGCCHSAPPPLHEAERSSVSSSNRWGEALIVFILCTHSIICITYSTGIVLYHHPTNIKCWSAWYPLCLLTYGRLTASMLLCVWHYPHGDHHGNQGAGCGFNYYTLTELYLQ